MTKILHQTYQALSRISRALSHIGAALLVIVLGVVFIDVIGRNLGGFGLPGTTEIATLLMLGLISISLPILQADRAFLAVDLVRDALGFRARTIVRLFMTVLQFVFMTLLSWRVWLYSSQQIETGRHTDVLQIPQYVPYLVALIALVVVGVTCVLQAAQLLAGLIRGEITDEPETPEPGQGPIA